jgi:ribosomal-protein-alanine N-acetyltransferase
MGLNNIKFRNAKISDTSSVMNIEYSSFSKETCEDEDVFEERIRVFSDGFRIMEYKKQIIGYICSEIWDSNDKVESGSFILGHSISKIHNPKAVKLYISSLALLPSYRNQGLGRLMFETFIEHMESSFPKLESAILIVSENWSEARKIYIDNRFEEIMKINNFFNCENKDNQYEDGIVMLKKFL